MSLLRIIPKEEKYPMKRIIIAISGASGAIYGVRLLQVLAEQPEIETHLIVSPAGELTAKHETGLSRQKLHSLASVAHDFNNIGASIASGTYPVAGMIVAPCSIKTLAAISISYADNLIVRSADVQLKEGRPLILMVRETPLHLGHLKRMTEAAQNGAIIMPPVPSFYDQPESIDDLVNGTVHKILGRFGLSGLDSYQWKGFNPA
jgi:polyprenyl P-hydroxybenzoate/phenylacrylic acid decarboxylase-like protein